MTEYIYKIRDLKTGKYSTGGSCPSWNKNGKVWKRPQDLTAHFNLITKSDYDEHYKNAVVECFEVKKSHEMYAKHYFDHARENKEKREREQRERIEKIQREQKRKQYEKLKKEFEGE